MPPPVSLPAAGRLVLHGTLSNLLEMSCHKHIPEGCTAATSELVVLQVEGADKGRGKGSEESTRAFVSNALISEIDARQLTLHAQTFGQGSCA